MDQPSDMELIRDCQRGEKPGFKALVDRYKDRAYSTAFRIVGNTHDAEDVAQEAFIAVYRSIRSFDLNRKFAPWLLKIVTNLSIDHLRRKRPQTVSWDSVEAAAEDADRFMDGIDPQKAVETSELCQLVEQLVIQLPPKYRAAVTLYYTEELTYNEVADAMDIPVGTVKTYLHRGREMLKKRLKGVLYEPLRA